MDEHYIVFKLLSGETVMSVLVSEDEDCIEVVNPILIRSAMITENTKEAMMASPLCPFSDERFYTLEKGKILFVKNLHPAFVAHYNRVVEEYEELQSGVEDLMVKETGEESTEESFYIEGNESIN